MDGTHRTSAMIVAAISVAFGASGWWASRADGRAGRGAETVTSVATTNATAVIPHGARLRIVSQNLATDEMALAILPTSSILAVSHFADDGRISNIARQAAAIPKRVSGDGEELVAMAPDVVLSDPFARRDTQLLLRQVGIPVRMFQSADSWAAVRDNLTALGKDVGAEARAAEVIRAMNARLSRVRQRTVALGHPRVLFYNDGYTAGSGTLMDDMLRTAGATNAAADYGIGGHSPVTLEQVFAMDPDVILVSDFDAGAKVRVLGTAPEALAHPAWRAVRAVASGHVYVVPARLTLSTSQHAAEGAETIARLLHPEAFAGIAQ